MSLDMSNIPKGPDFSGISNPVMKQQLEDRYWNDKTAGLDDGTSASKVPKSDLDKMLGILGEPEQKLSGLADSVAKSVLTDNNTSADKAAQTANSTSLEWLREVMKYNAEQAEINRQFQQTSADKAAQFESAEAQKLRDWQERLSNTQYQRAVADLKKAGINPILAAQYLSGASTPSGASASGFAASGSSATASQTSAQKAEVDLNSAAKIIIAYLEANTKLTTAEIQAVTSMFGSVLGALG